MKDICSSPLTLKRFVKYVHASTPYLATLFKIEWSDQNEWVNVKLCNNGFVYLYMPGETIERHNSEGWIQFDECLQEMLNLKNNLCNAGFESIAAFYSYVGQHLDIKAWTLEDDALNLYSCLNQDIHTGMMKELALKFEMQELKTNQWLCIFGL